MKQTINVYVAQRPINEFNILPGAQLYVKDNVIYNIQTGKQYPSYLNVNSTAYFKKMPYEYPVEPGDCIVYYGDKKGNRSKHIYTGTVSAIDERFITVIRDGTVAVFDTIPHSAIKSKRNIYYFINSAGIISKAIAGVNHKADKFRKQIGNYFVDKNLASIKLYELLHK